MQNNVILSYLLRDRISQRTPVLIENLIRLSETNKKAFAVLIADAARPENVSAFQMQALTFLQSNLDVDKKLLLLLTLLLHDSMRPALINTKQIPVLINQLLSTNQIDYFDIASMLIIKLIPQMSFAEQLKQNNVTKSYVQVAMTQKRRSAVRLGIYTIDVLARSGLIDDLIPSIEWILPRAVPNNFNAVFALSALASIGSSPAGSSSLSRTTIKETISSFHQNQQAKPYVDALLSEIK